jgi:hypothetical protein
MVSIEINMDEHTIVLNIDRFALESLDEKFGLLMSTNIPLHTSFPTCINQPCAQQAAVGT